MFRKSPKTEVANPTSTNRLQKDYCRLLKDPVPYVVACPKSDNILEWHYVLAGPPDTPYDGGYYHGKLLFPAEYPFKPPSIYMITPSGRFVCDTRLCLSMSDYHPESWNPSWSTSTLLVGLLSFMLEESNAIGSMKADDDMRRELAKKSLEYNLANPEFCQLFPDLCLELGENSDEEEKPKSDHEN